MTDSPDGQHHAQLVHAGEVRFGPAYHRLILNGVEIAGRIFGKGLWWSGDSKLLAAEEWLTSDYERGPITRVLLFDLERHRASPLRTIEKGFPEAGIFEGTRFFYRRHHHHPERIVEVEVDISSIRNWEPYQAAR
jgi:hypothetical protein